MMKLFTVLCVFIGVSYGFVFDILKKYHDFKGIGQFKNLKGVPNITVCNPPNAKPELIWKSYNITPPDIKPDEDFYCTANGTLLETVTGGNINVNIDVGPYNVLNEDVNLCDYVSYAGLQCPLPAGPINLYAAENVPAPFPGTYNITTNFTDQNGKFITCVNIVANLS
eukprot:457500_1